jgi:hypothetical protein
MATEKKVSLAAVNITIHPHTLLKYVQLFKDAKRLKCFSRIAKDRAGLIASVGYIDRTKGETSPITGDLYRFTQLDLNGNWFNTDTNQHAEEGELDAVSIPDNLKPNSSRFSYIFFPESHILFYESYYDGHKIGHESALKLIHGVLNSEKLIDQYGTVDVTTIPSKEALTKALAIARMDKLTFLIKRPNPDTNEKSEREVLRRLNAQNVAVYKHEMRSISGQSIEPDTDTKKLANIAAKNGMVEVKGRDKVGHPVEYKTQNHPWSHSEYYDPKIGTAFYTFSNTVFNVRNEVENWTGDD